MACVIFDTNCMKGVTPLEINHVVPGLGRVKGTDGSGMKELLRKRREAWL